MRFGTTSFLRSIVRTTLIALTLLGIPLATRAAYAQGGQDPDAGPPRTPTPPPSVVAPSAQESATPSATPQDQQQSIVPEGNADDSGRFVFKKQVQEVVLHATVVDETGRLMAGLEQGAFSIYVNGKLEPITSFRREDVPVAIGIVVDNSGSMRDKRDQVSQAVLNLIRASNPQDEVFVVNFGQTPYLDQDFTSDVKLLQAALHQTSTRGSTALYDAVVASTVHLQNNPRLTKKVLLVITDGQDNMSRETLQEAIRKLQPNKGSTVYAIGLTDEGLTRSGREALQSLASSTGGVAFFPQSLDEVNEITRSVAHDIRSQYTLAFKPGNAAQKGYQSIRVEAKGPSKNSHLTVRTRTGYYPGETVH